MSTLWSRHRLYFLFRRALIWSPLKEKEKEHFDCSLGSLIVGQVLGVWLHLSLIENLLFKNRPFSRWDLRLKGELTSCEIGLPSRGKIWKFSCYAFMLSSQLLLEMFWRSQIPKKKAFSFPAESEKMTSWSEPSKSWNYFLGWAPLIAHCGNRHINEWLTQAKTKCSFFQLLLSLSPSPCLEITECTDQDDIPCTVQTHTLANYTNGAADENRRSELWIIEPSR